MNGNNAEYVSTGKPKTSGAVFTAPKGTTLPTDAVTPLDTISNAYICLGHVSDEGLSNANDMDVSKIKAWGGVIVYRSLNELTDDFKLKLIESENPDVLKAAYGTNNVTVDRAGNIAVSVKADDPEERVWIFDLALRGDKKKRIVVMDGAVTAREEITYNDSDPIAYGLTISAYPDGTGTTHREYIEGRPLASPVVQPESPAVELFDTLVSDMQTNVTVGNGSISGTLKFIEGGLAQSGPLAGDGNFLALKFTGLDTKATSVKVGLEPSLGTGLVEIINDPDRNGVFKVSGEIDGVQQVFKVVSTDGTNTQTDIYTLDGLTLEEE